MAYRKLKNIKGKILDEALEIGANEGVYNITARKIAKNCDISTHTIYNHFLSMRDLIDSIAFNYDRKYMEDIKKVILKGYSKQKIFYHFLDIFIKEKSNTLYYISYVHCYGFNPTTKNDRTSEFVIYARYIFNDNLDDNTIMFLWDFITRILFYYAEKIIKGFIPYDEHYKSMMLNAITQGINSFIKNAIK